MYTRTVLNDDAASVKREKDWLALANSHKTCNAEVVAEVAPIGVETKPYFIAIRKIGGLKQPPNIEPGARLSVQCHLSLFHDRKLCFFGRTYRSKQIPIAAIQDNSYSTGAEANFDTVFLHTNLEPNHVRLIVEVVVLVETMRQGVARTL